MVSPVVKTASPFGLAMLTVGELSTLSTVTGVAFVVLLALSVVRASKVWPTPSSPAGVCQANS